MAYDHMHLGAGRRSIGAILPLADRAGARLHVVVHEGTQLHEDACLCCAVSGADGERVEQDLPLASLSIANTLDGLVPAARAALAEAPELLITTALTDLGIAAQSDLIVAMAQERKGQPTTLVACEEDFGEHHEQLFARLRELDVDVRRGIVTRLCTADAQSTDRRRRGVHADAYVEWCIEGEPRGASLEALAASSEVTFTDDFDCHALRARWLARGMLLELALLAGAANRPHVRLEAIAQDREGWLERVCDAFVPLIEQRCGELPDTAEYARRQAEALVRHDDDGQWLRRRLRRSDLVPFMREVEELIGEPCRSLVENSGEELPAYLHRVFHSLYIVLSDIGKYNDVAAWRESDMVLTAEADDRILEAYRDLLTGIMSRRDVNARVHSLTLAFDTHRGDFGTRVVVP